MASLHVLRGMHQGQIFRVDAPATRLGRSSECEVPLPLTSVSRQHARILRVQGRYYIEDMQSRNGTKVNGQRITARTPLAHGDEVQICDFVARFRTSEGPPSSDSVPTTEEQVDSESSTIIRGKLNHSSNIFLAIDSTEKLKIILAASNSFRNTLERDQLLPKVGDSLLQLFKHAEYCFVLLVDQVKGELELVHSQCRPDSATRSGRFNPTLATNCFKAADGLIASEPRSTLCVPLCSADGTPFGVIQLDCGPAGRVFQQEDLQLLMSVANQASIALENATLHEELLKVEKVELDLELAGQVQRSFLPDSVPELPGYEFHAHYDAVLDVGGDYYDFIPLPGARVAVTQGDVAGKGMPAALLMAKLCSDMRYCLLAEESTAAAVNRLNEVLHRQMAKTDRFVTLTVAALDPLHHTVTVVNAGHMAPLLYRHAERRLVPALAHELSGPPLGCDKSRRYQFGELRLEPGDCLLLYTDGVTDQLDPNKRRFGVPGVQKAVLSGTSYSPRAVVERVTKAVAAHAAGVNQHDDITMVSFARTL